MAFFNSAVQVLQPLVVAIGAGLGIWGAISSLGIFCLCGFIGQPIKSLRRGE